MALPFIKNDLYLAKARWVAIIKLLKKPPSLINLMAE
jgi:hypothetical protein